MNASTIQTMVTKERNFNSFLNAYVPVGTVISTLDNGTTVFYFPDGTFKQLANNEPAMYSIASGSATSTADPFMPDAPPADDDYLFSFYPTYTMRILVGLDRTGNTLTGLYSQTTMSNVYVATEEKYEDYDGNIRTRSLGYTDNIGRIQVATDVTYIGSQLVIHYALFPVFNIGATFGPFTTAAFSLDSSHSVVSECYVNPSSTMMFKRSCKTGLLFNTDSPTPDWGTPVFTQHARKAVTSIIMDAAGLKKTLVDDQLTGDVNPTTTTVIGKAPCP